MSEKAFNHAASPKITKKLHLLAQKPGIDLGNPWVTLRDANAQNEDKCCIRSYLLLVTCYLLLVTLEKLEMTTG
ncbi:MAG: hypothetical protein F6K41_37175 [Symploca sp. SIO3E6]|nr:hypothetical protein [Caldora sp. SIO3E6]